MSDKPKHSMTEPMYWKCPECKACAEIDNKLDYGHLESCAECTHVVCPHIHLCTWDDFAAYCMTLKS